MMLSDGRMDEMIKNPKILRKFEMELVRKSKLDYKKNMAIFEALNKEAILVLGKKKRDPLEGLETIVKIARIINNV